VSLASHIKLILVHEIIGLGRPLASRRNVSHYFRIDAMAELGGYLYRQFHPELCFRRASLWSLDRFIDQAIKAITSEDLHDSIVPSIEVFLLLKLGLQLVQNKASDFREVVCLISSRLDSVFDFVPVVIIWSTDPEKYRSVVALHPCVLSLFSGSLGVFLGEAA
jgi:hypothetical protein